MKQEDIPRAKPKHNQQQAKTRQYHVSTLILLLYHTRPPAGKNSIISRRPIPKFTQSPQTKALLTSVVFAAPSMPLTNLMAPP